MNSNNKLMVAVVLIVLAVAIAFWQWNSNKPSEGEFRNSSAMDYQKEIDRIQNDPNMPPQAKAIAIQQIQQRMQNAGSVSQELNK